MIRLYRVSGQKKEREGMQMCSLNKVQMEKGAGRKKKCWGNRNEWRGIYVEQSFKNYSPGMSGWNYRLVQIVPIDGRD